MPAPLPSWDLVRVYGTWRGMDGALRAGTYKVTIPARITNITDDAIIPAGTYAQGALQTAVDGSPSFDLLVPATDDPDNEQTGWKVTVDVSFTDAAPEKYVIEVPIANRPTASGGNGQGVNLRTVAIAAQLPQQVALYRVGVPGGLARLDADGNVIDADGSPVTGGGAVDSVNGKTGAVALTAADVGALPSSTVIPAAATWDTLSGKPAVIAAGTSATAARAAIGAGTSSLQLGTGSTTAKAGDWTPDWSEVKNKPANFPATPHSHPTADVTGLDTALAGKANVEDVPTTLSSLGGTITTAQMAPRSVICAIWDGTTWTNSPAGSRKDIMVQWVDPIGTSTTPPFVAGRVDVYIKAQP